MIIYENVEYDSIESYDDLKRVFDMLNRIEIKRKYNDSKNKWYYFEDNFIVELIGNNILKNVGLIRLDTPLKNTDGGIINISELFMARIDKNHSSRWGSSVWIGLDPIGVKNIEVVK
jgi:hypothetical protein